jgi:hypothetical protein
MRLSSMLVFAALSIVVGCGGGNGSAANCSDVVDSPGGPVPKACVYAVPNGGEATFGDGGTTVVSVNGKVVATYPPCPCTGSGRVGGRGDAGADADR